MTPKEKAEQLFTKFADIEHLGVYGNYDGTWEWSSSLWRKQAKESALIAIDEIIEERCFHNEHHQQNSKLKYHIEIELAERLESTRNYWSEVKHEIEKL